MAIAVGTPGVDGLGAVVAALREWQHDGAPTQLHPGDVGWFWRSGATATAAALRVWRGRDRVLAVGLLDGPALLRVTLAPDAARDGDLARRMAEDVTDPASGVLPEGEVFVESPRGTLFHDLLPGHGWHPAPQLWTPLRRDLSAPVPAPGVRIEVAGRERAAARAAVHRASFDGSTFTEDRWHAMAAGLPYPDARCLVAYDSRDTPVAAVTVWSADQGKPGLLEPMGVHHDHRGRGHGRAITLAAAATLRSLGASAALVCTPSANTAAVATYTSAGFAPLQEVRGHRRNA